MSNSKNIKLYTLEYPPQYGGVGNYYYHLVKYWPGADLIPTLSLNEGEGGDGSPSLPRRGLGGGDGVDSPPLGGGARGGDGGITVITNDSNQLVDDKRPFIKWWPAVKTMLRDLKDGDTVLIGQLLPLGTAALIASYFRKFDYFVILHGMDLGVALRQWRKRWLVRRIISRAKGVIAANHYTAEMLTEFMGRDLDMVVVNPGIEPGMRINYEPTPTPPERGLKDDLAPALLLSSRTTIRDPENTEQNNNGRGSRVPSPSSDGSGPRMTNNKAVTRSTPALSRVEGSRVEGLHVTPHSGDFIILSLGRLVKRKGFDTMIQAMPNIVEFTPRVRYLIAGAGPDEQYLRDLVDTLEPNTREKIMFTGAPDDAEKWRLINSCDVLVMPAREIDGDFEGFGIVFLEAALAGKAVIGARSGGAEEAIENDETGILVEPDNPDELADRVIDLIRDFRFKEGLGYVGRERAIREFNWEGQARKIYEFLISNS